MSVYVKKVQFKLHESYANSVRGKHYSRASSPELWFNCCSSFVVYFFLDASFLKVVSFWIFIFFVYVNFIVFWSISVINKPPYEVTETGWGEFEVVIKIYFNDVNERPVRMATTNKCMHTNLEMNTTYFYSWLYQITVYHLLKLFQNDPDIMMGKKSLVVEHYDEMVGSRKPLNIVATPVTN